MWMENLKIGDLFYNNANNTFAYIININTERNYFCYKFIWGNLIEINQYRLSYFNDWLEVNNYEKV